MNSSIEVAREIRNAISNGVTEKYVAAQIDEVRKPLVNMIREFVNDYDNPLRDHSVADKARHLLAEIKEDK